MAFQPSLVPMRAMEFGTFVLYPNGQEVVNFQRSGAKFKMASRRNLCATCSGLKIWISCSGAVFLLEVYVRNHVGVYIITAFGSNVVMVQCLRSDFSFFIRITVARPIDDKGYVA